MTLRISADVAHQLLTQALAGDHDAWAELSADVEHRLGWTGVAFAPPDVENLFRRRLAPEEWERLRATPGWVGLMLALNRLGNDLIERAGYQAGIRRETG